MIRSMLGLIAAGAIGAGVLPVHAASVTYVAQTRLVEVHAGRTLEVDEATDSALSPGFGPFDEAVSLEFRDPVDGDGVFVDATQRSVLLEDRISAEGMLSARGSEFGTAKSILEILFDMEARAEFSLSLDVLFDRTPNTARGPEARLLRVTEEDEVVLAEITWDDLQKGPIGFTDERSGSLSPGRYLFQFDGVLDNIGDAPHRSTAAYSTGLRLESPAVIPLPPALWAGLMMLGGLAGRSQLKRLRLRIQ